MIRFGPSGNSESFYEQGYKSSVQMPAWLCDMGLNAYEYQCSKGIKVSESTARNIGEEASKNGIYLSIHAPYYINMASEEEEKRINSKRYILETLICAKWMRAKRIVVHTGSYSKVDKKWALKMACEVMKEVLGEAKESGLDDVGICPEVLGKQNQLGSLEEIIEICKIDESLIPTVDFGHIHARGLGILNSIEDFEAVLNTIENALGFERLKNLHCHFSRIEFTKGGEKRHWTIDDIQFGPEFEYLAEAIYKKKMEPVIICESRDNMAEDALKLKKIYENVAGDRK
ncbi:TIM barrel protein [Acetivibrio cellulolyticus]|uniref:TIM barrel protein n=1 Tax=Acetivibrio cellulolyticus TaxID=35830 RepID=UPI0001E2DE58|nr:TIM barrel protein [Acetivibrio cellulolyticus]